MFFDFGVLPPEINSGRMYAGPGPAPLLAAASAWDGIATELHSTAASYGSVISGLTAGPWTGPAATSMSAAAAPYVTWLTATGAQAEQTANQARAAAVAYEAAFAATVPPPVIAANRAQLMSLIATNILGQNTPAIAATEAHYAEMWAQDATAMHVYAGASAATWKFTPFAPPAQNTNPGAAAAQAAAVGNASAVSAGTNAQTVASAATTPGSALGHLVSSSGSSMSLKDVLGYATMVPQNSSYLLSLGNSMNGLSKAFTGSTSAASGAAATMAPALSSGTGGLSGLSGLGNAGSAVSAGLGRAGTIGPLSVPQTWAAAAPNIGAGTSALPGPGFGASSAGAGNPSMLGGMPMLANAARGGTPAGATPRFDMRPVVVPHSPAAG